MVEAVMIFALGFLSAALLALLIVPAVNARAERLARRRVEAQLPLSIAELNAERDALRADLAVRERRMEQRVAEVLETKREDMEELGRRALRIEALDSTVKEREGQITELEGILRETRETLADREAALARESADLAGARETLTALESAHRATLGELAETRGTLDTTSADLAQTRTALAAAEERIETLRAELTELQGRHDATLGDLDTRRITISDLETRLATQTARATDFERLAGERKDEQERLREQGDAVRAELDLARAEALRLRDEIEDLRRDGLGAEIRAENAALRQRIDEVADEIMRSSAANEARPPARAAAS